MKRLRDDEFDDGGMRKFSPASMRISRRLNAEIFDGGDGNFGATQRRIFRRREDG